jgi:hypothetical protein
VNSVSDKMTLLLDFLLYNFYLAMCTHFPTTHHTTTHHTPHSTLHTLLRTMVIKELIKPGTVSCLTRMLSLLSDCATTFSTFSVSSFSHFDINRVLRMRNQYHPESQCNTPRNGASTTLYGGSSCV